MVMLLDTVPEEPPGNLKICKRMKKRKQLDALHTNNKPNKRFKNSSFASGVSHGLLKNCSDSSDFEEYSVNTRRRGPKHRFISRHMCRALMPITLFILVTACIIATATLVWLHLILRSNLEVLRLHLQKVESDAEDTPRTLHSIHSQIKKITTDLDSFKDQLFKATTSVSKNERELINLHETSKHLKESLASAPEIHGLPKTIQSLSENLASIGSKILALETMVKDLKIQHAELTNSHQQQMSDLDVMKSSVHQLWKEVKTQKRNVAATISRSGINSTQSQLLSHLKEEVQKLGSELGSLNGTLLPKANILNNTLHLTMGLFTKQQRELGALREYVYGNITSGLHNLTHCPNIKNMFMNCNVSVFPAHSNGFNLTENWIHLEELIKLYSSLKSEIKQPKTGPTSSAKEWLHVILDDFLSPHLESITHQLGALDSQTKNLKMDTAELKKEFDLNMGHLSNFTRLNTSCCYFGLIHSNLSAPESKLKSHHHFGGIKNDTFNENTTISSTISSSSKAIYNLSMISSSGHDEDSKEITSTKAFSKVSPSATSAVSKTLTEPSMKVLKSTPHPSHKDESISESSLLMNQSHSAILSTESISFTSTDVVLETFSKEKESLLTNVSSTILDTKHTTPAHISSPNKKLAPDETSSPTSPLLLPPTPSPVSAKAVETSTIFKESTASTSIAHSSGVMIAVASTTTGNGAIHSTPTLLARQKTTSKTE